MNPNHRSTLSIVALLVGLACFLVALLLATNEVFHNGNHAAWQDGGFVAVTVALLARWWA